MKKNIKKMAFALGILFLFQASIVSADVINIRQDEVIYKSQFYFGSDINNDGTIKGDVIAGAKMISSTGIIDGDLFVGGQAIRSSGKVMGDIIGGGKDVDISGVVEGNIRCVGEHVIIGDKVGRNVNIFASNATIKKDATIGGNLLAMGEYIKVEGIIKGHTKIFGNRIVLGGEFFGDVDINVEIPDSLDMAHNDDFAEGYVTILSGTIIHGKLTYKTLKEARIESGAKLNAIEWKEMKLKEKEAKFPGAVETSWDFIKMLLSTLAYFLVALLLVKFLPKTFKRQSEMIDQKPFQLLGIGLLGLVSIIATLIVLIILIVLSVLFSAPMLAVVVVFISIVFYMVLFYLATIPVALWVGNRIMRESSTAWKLAAGLVSISVCLFVLAYFANLPVIGALFGFIAFLIGFTVILAGSGALLVSLKETLASVKTYEQAQDVLQIENNSVDAENK